MPQAQKHFDVWETLDGGIDLRPILIQMDNFGALLRHSADFCKEGNQSLRSLLTK